MIFFRVGNLKTGQGLWYTTDGKFTGYIHNKFSFCKNKDLEMPYDKKVVGYLSATASLHELYEWFTKEDIKKLESYGYGILVYDSNDYFFHNSHWLINKDSELIDTIKVEEI